MRPEEGLRWPETMLIKVVFPAPFGPITQRTSPSCRVKSIASLAISPRKRLLKPSVRSSSATFRLHRASASEAHQRAGDTAAERHNHNDEDQPDDQLPIFRRNRGEVVGQSRHPDSTEQGAEQRLAPADSNPNDNLRREQDAGKRWRNETGMRAVERAGQAGNRAGEGKGRGFVKRRAKTERKHAILI